MASYRQNKSIAAGDLVKLLDRIQTALGVNIENDEQLVKAVQAARSDQILLEQSEKKLAAIRKLLDTK